MKVELRADGTLHISGYVNVTGKMSRPVITAKGQRVIEVIEERTFQNALSKATNVKMTKDHNPNCVLAETRANTLTLHEDSIGLRAEADITDETTIMEAKEGKIKGWSFGMRNIIDKIEERAEQLPIRHVKGFDLDHITLVVNKTPVYAATSVELRADDELEELETRAFDDDLQFVNNKKEKTYDNSEFEKRLEKLKVAE
ncbi:MAG: HK97 family phage prohead protease [Lachnospiraceae bacterium]|nr:HK97 family phage prohead protease [Lachnospiraceae bacterium]